MHAKLSIEEIEVFEELAQPFDSALFYENPKALGAYCIKRGKCLVKARRICYLKRAEIRMQKRISHKCENGMPGANYETASLE